MSHKQGHFKYASVYDFLTLHSLKSCKVKQVISLDEEPEEPTELGFKCVSCMEVFIYDEIQKKGL